MATATSYTKAGVDSKAAPLATSTPLAPSGTGAPGTSGAAARADHVHPVQTGLTSQNIVPGLNAYPIGPPMEASNTDLPNGRIGMYPFSWFPGRDDVGLGAVTVLVRTAGNAGAVGKCRIFPVIDGVATFDDYVADYPDIDLSTTGVKTVNPSSPTGHVRGFFAFGFFITGATTTVPELARAAAWGSPLTMPLQGEAAVGRQYSYVAGAASAWPSTGQIQTVDGMFTPWFNIQATATD